MPGERMENHAGGTTALFRGGRWIFYPFNGNCFAWVDAPQISSFKPKGGKTWRKISSYTAKTADRIPVTPGRHTQSMLITTSRVTRKNSLKCLSSQTANAGCR